MREIETWTIEEVARELAVLWWHDIQDAAAHTSAIPDAKKRAATLRALEQSADESDRYTAAIVRRWDRLKKQRKG